MCINDWRIGRLIRSVFYPAEGHVGSTLTLPTNYQRVGLTLTAIETAVPTGGGILAQDGSTGNTIFMLSPEASIFHCTLATHGDLPMRRWFFTPVGGTTLAFSVIEYIAPEEYLASALEQFQTEYGKRGF